MLRKKKNAPPWLLLFKCPLERTVKELGRRKLSFDCDASNNKIHSQLPHNIRNNTSSTQKTTDRFVFVIPYLAGFGNFKRNAGFSHTIQKRSENQQLPRHNLLLNPYNVCLLLSWKLNEYKITNSTLVCFKNILLLQAIFLLRTTLFNISIFFMVPVMQINIS